MKTKGPKSVSRPKVDNSRKAQRKQKRQQKKVHRQEHYLKKKPPKLNNEPKYAPGKFVKRPIDDVETTQENKKKKQKLQPTAQEIVNRQREKELKEANRLKSQMDEQRKKMFHRANDDEDKIIKKLEKQLGLNKSKNKNNYFADDGLDYLLEICDKSTTEQIVAAEKHLAEVDNNSDFEEDLATVTGKGIEKKNKESKAKNKIKYGDESDLESNDEEEDSDNISDESIDDVEGVLSDEFDNTDSDIDEEGSENSDEEPEETPTKSQKATDKNSKKILKKEIKSKEGSNSSNKHKEKIVKADELSKVFSDDEVSHLSGDEDLDDFSGDEIDNNNEDHDSKKPDKKPDEWEDIYGRKRDKEGNVIKEEKKIYIPPHLRDKDSSSDKELAQLKRQMQSVINKLAGTNLHYCSTSIESLYNGYSRHAVNSALGRLWGAAAAGADPTPPRLAAELAALVAILHANVGSEIGAHFLQELCRQFDELVSSPQPMADKRLDNTVLALANLYSFKICHAPLLYDVLERLLETLSEKHIDCVLGGLRAVGGALRKEEPLALKEFIQNTQRKAAGLNEDAASGSRMKFLLEVLMAIKNNNLTKIPNYDPSYSEQLKKSMRTVVRRGNSVTPLNIRLEDLLKADERGKWWVVGSAWAGARSQPAAQPARAAPYDAELLRLARAQRMNTDVRRSIFCVIMSAEDYMDAFAKLERLNVAAREVAAVLTACCVREASYNPYYAALAAKLCHSDRKHQLSLQFSVWDKIKELEKLPKQAAVNLAQLLVTLILEKALPLSVLKIIEFSELNRHSVRFMRQILLAIIMHEDLQTSLQAFHRIAKPPKLRTFRESLRLFVQHFLIKNADKGKKVLSDEEMEVLKQRAVEVDKILNMHESKLML